MTTVPVDKRSNAFVFLTVCVSRLRNVLKTWKEFRRGFGDISTVSRNLFCSSLITPKSVSHQFSISTKVTFSNKRL